MSEQHWNIQQPTENPVAGLNFTVDNRAPWSILRGKPTLRQLLRYWWRNGRKL